MIVKEIIGLSKGIEFKIKKKDMLSLRKQIQHWGLSILIKSINNSEYPEMGCKVYPNTWRHRVTRKNRIKSTKWIRGKKNGAANQQNLFVAHKNVAK